MCETQFTKIDKFKSFEFISKMVKIDDNFNHVCVYLSFLSEYEHFKLFEEFFAKTKWATLPKIKTLNEIPFTSTYQLFTTIPFGYGKQKKTFSQNLFVLPLRSKSDKF